jgi:hypothetical protein
MKGFFWGSLFSLSQYFASFSRGIKDFFLLDASIGIIAWQKPVIPSI